MYTEDRVRAWGFSLQEDFLVIHHTSIRGIGGSCLGGGSIHGYIAIHLWNYIAAIGAHSPTTATTFPTQFIHPSTARKITHYHPRTTTSRFISRAETARKHALIHLRYHGNGPRTHHHHPLHRLPHLATQNPSPREAPNLNTPHYLKHQPLLFIPPITACAPSFQQPPPPLHYPSPHASPHRSKTPRIILSIILNQHFPPSRSLRSCHRCRQFAIARCSR